MAENTRYHLLPDENRPSLDSTIGDDQQLLEPTDDGQDTPPSKTKELTFSYHPTLVLRLLNIILFTISLAFFIVTRDDRTIAAIVFTCFALLRNLLVLSHHLSTRWIHIRFEMVATSKSVRAKKTPAWLGKAIQIALDQLLVFTLLITVTVAYKSSHSYWYGWEHPLLLPACVLGWIAIPIQSLVSFDIGTPRRFTINGGISFISGDKPTEKDMSIAPRYSDIETAPQPQTIGEGSALAESSNIV